MVASQNKLTKFFQELKRRKVIAVIVVYATTAIILLELSGNLEESLNLPEWFDTVVTIILIIGFPIAVIFSWIFDVTSKGITKTEAEAKEDVPPAIIEDSAYDKSIVVLPFENISSDPEQEYFCDGIAEEIINSLTHLSELKVIARTSAFSFKGQNVDVREIGKKLDVNYLLEGSLRKAGNKIRITAQLIKLSDGSHLYSERFDRELDDIFEIQDEISLAIVDKLKVKLFTSEKKALLKRYTGNVEVYTLYLLGRHHNYMFTEEDASKAKKYFDDALKIDSEYVPAYVGLCLYYIVLGGGGLNILPPKEAIPKAKRACLRALQIDPEYAEAHSNLSMIYNMYEWAWEKGEYHAKRAIELEPKNAEAQRYYAWNLTFQGKPEKAVAKIKEAINLDPLQALTYQNAAAHNYFARDFEMSIKYGEKTLSVNPYFEIVKILLGTSYIQNARYEEAIQVLENMVSYPGISDSYLGFAYALTGKTKEAHNILDKLDQLNKKGLVSASGIALTHLGFGNYQKVIELVEISLTEKPAYSWHTAFIHVDPIWDPIRNEPEFQKIMSKIRKDD